MIYRPDIEKIVEHLGGAAALCEYHAAVAPHAGFEELPLNTILSWVRNNKKNRTHGISLSKLMEIKCVADELQLPFNLWEFCSQEPLVRKK